MKKYGVEAVYRELEKQVAAETQAGLALRLGLSPQYLCDVRRRRRPLTKELAGHLGFEEMSRQFVKRQG